MEGDRATVFARLTIALAGFGYLLVFFVALATGATAEVALVKALAAMVCLGILGRIALPIVLPPEQERELKTQQTQAFHLDVSISDGPDEPAGKAPQ